jgi:glycolate oxidase subunit GlcD
MIPRELIRELRQIVGDRHVCESRASAELYSYDGSLARGAPGAVAFPGDSGEAARVVKAAARAKVPFVPRGFGTNLSGGTVLPYGGLTVCLSRLNRILGISTASRTAVVQPGVTNLELQSALAPLGFFYAPDPASQKVATLGGNVGENSGGPRCLKYGVTTNHILGLEAVLADGETLRLGGPALDPPGYDLRGFIVGSEGTLAVVTEVTVRILPKAETVVTQLAVYDSVAAAARSVSDIIGAGIVPATLEMMDAPIIRAVEDSYTCGYPRDAAAVLIIEVEGPETGLAPQAQRIRGICMANGCREIRDAATAGERNRLWEGRRGAFGAVARLAPNYLVNDCTVPRTRLPEALAQVAAIVRKYGFEHGNVFHAGDGNLHPLILFDSRDSQQLERVHQAGWEIMQACVELGGTISGEHGIGLEKLEAMRFVFTDDDIDAQRSLQEAFDPARLLNPGKVFPDTRKPFAFKAQALRAADGNGFAAAEKSAAAAVHRALAAGEAVAPLGSGTQKDFGNLPRRPAAALSTATLASIIEIDPANQVVTSGCGATLESLQQALAAHNQWLPLRPPLALLRRTLGGIIAVGACGPERIVYGAPRDLLLGLWFVDGRGRLIHAGGKVVKNVAGYDMTRLIAGSAGTLGLITQATLKTLTRPERCAAISAVGTLDGCADLALEALKSNIGAVFAAAESQGAESGWRLSIGFEGFGDTVASQLARARAVVGRAGLQGVAERDYDLLEGPFAEVYGRIAACPFVIQLNAAADLTASAARALCRQTSPQGLLADFGGGRVTVGSAALSPAAWPEICRHAAREGGHALLEKAPDDFKKDRDVFGPNRPEWKVMRRIKAILDPKHVFAPGRMPGRV